MNHTPLLQFEWEDNVVEGFTTSQQVPPHTDSQSSTFKNQIKSNMPYLLSGLVGIFLGVGAVILVQNTIQNPPPSIVILDMKKIVRTESGRLSTKNRSEEDIKAAINQLPSKLDQILKRIFGNKKPLILKPGAVLSSLPDITPQVLEAIAQEDAQSLGLKQWSLRYANVRFIGWTLFGLTLFWLVLNRTSLHINASLSLREKAFLVLKDMSLQKGDYVLIQDYHSAYGRYKSIIKRLVGTSGDRVTQKTDGVYVNEIFIGPCVQKTSQGKPLNAIKNQIIPQGYVFVCADHPKSFDSRYQEFGLVPEAHIQGRALGMF